MTETGRMSGVTDIHLWREAKPLTVYVNQTHKEDDGIAGSIALNLDTGSRAIDIYLSADEAFDIVNELTAVLRRLRPESTRWEPDDRVALTDYTDSAAGDFLRRVDEHAR